MQDLPIDIHIRKLLDWLVSRRHCDREWRGAANLVRQQVSAALQEMPEHGDIVELIRNNELNYFTCEKVFELLKQSGDSSKSILGYYRSKKLQDWQSIMATYRENNLFMADASDVLAQNVIYKLPSLKKLIARNEQLQTEYRAKKASCLKNAKMLEKQYSADCAQLGVEGKDLETEIQHLLSQLPQILTEFADKRNHLLAAIDYYTAFVKCLNYSCQTEGVISTLAYFVEHGNVTVYQFKTGKAPPAELAGSTTPDKDPSKDSTKDSSDEIDWGSDIDYSVVECDDFVCVSESGSTEIITKDESESGSAEIITTDESARPLIDQGDLETLLENPLTRANIVNDLIELETFLAQRQCELCESDSVLASASLGSLPLLDGEGLRALLEPVRGALAELDSERLRQLLLMNSQPSYVERLLKPIRSKLSSSQQSLARADRLDENCKTKSQEISECQSKVNALVEQNKHLKSQLEDAISEKYSGRPVHLILAA